MDFKILVRSFLIQHDFFFCDSKSHIVISWSILSSNPPPTQPFLCCYASFSEKTAAEKQATFLIVFLV